MRSTHRNGYRPRSWETRVGEIELAIPRKRSAPSYFPSFLQPRRRSEQAIVAVVAEAYVNGVSTRKVERLVEQLGTWGMSKDRVSALCRALDEQVQAFRERPLKRAYPYLWLDAKQVKVRDHGRVVSEAVVVAYAVHQSGVREVIGLDLAAGARVQLLCLLAQGPRSVKDLASAAGIEQPAASQHLRVLRNLGFVRARKKGRHKIYELCDSHVAGVLEQAIAHAEHLRDHLSLCAGEESVVAGSRRREALGRAS